MPLDFEDEYAALPCEACGVTVPAFEMSFLLCAKCQETKQIWKNFAPLEFENGIAQG